MDPASVISIVSAAGSLVFKCGTIIQALHDLAERYKHAELTIMAIIQECHTIELAWSRIERWLACGLHRYEDSYQLGNRIALAVSSGQLIMAELEKDLASIEKTAPQRAFRRRTKLLWNEKMLQAHQYRIRGQVGALTLLLEVIQLPSDSDRTDSLSVKEPIFRMIEDSVRSVVPSRLSIHSDTASITSAENEEVWYIPFDFENDLFTSYVYKRNFRVPQVAYLSQRPAPYEIPVVNAELATNGDGPICTSPDEAPVAISKPCQHTFPDLDQESLESLSRKIRQGRHDIAVDYVQKTGVELLLAPFTCGCGNVENPDLNVLLRSLQEHNIQLFRAFMETAAFAFGEHVLIRLVDSLVLSDSRVVSMEDTASQETSITRNWTNSILHDPGVVEELAFRRELASSDILRRYPTALQLACATKREKIVEYLLHMGRLDTPLDWTGHPFILATKRRCRPILELLLEFAETTITETIKNTALVMVVNRDCALAEQWTDAEQNDNERVNDDVDIVRLLLLHDASPNTRVTPEDTVLSVAIRAALDSDPRSMQLIDILLADGAVVRPSERFLLFTAPRKAFGPVLERHDISARSGPPFQTSVLHIPSRVVNFDGHDIYMLRKQVAHERQVNAVETRYIQYHN
ncbi:hypothetical protein EJ04DRAFT_101995 [Polyplosphaeria fusca]|uniref:Ankyrin repeat protein n=1 Tax=Polyplosphaeria fusca TaxID=682080 RepID=A0A9P4UWW0_9PLEO|nr:hypothetical protein EJ04DRAFT_101995 [Polyplosphaeria fusca]